MRPRRTTGRRLNRWPTSPVEGKRTGRPLGSKNYARTFADAVWAYQHRDEDTAAPPTRNAWVWWSFAAAFPDELELWLDEMGQL